MVARFIDTAVPLIDMRQSHSNLYIVLRTFRCGQRYFVLTRAEEPPPGWRSGVDLRLGTRAWGLFCIPKPSVRELHVLEGRQAAACVPNLCLLLPRPSARPRIGEQQSPLFSPTITLCQGRHIAGPCLKFLQSDWLAGNNPGSVDVARAIKVLMAIKVLIAQYLLA